MLSMQECGETGVGSMQNFLCGCKRGKSLDQSLPGTRLVKICSETLLSVDNLRGLTAFKDIASIKLHMMVLTCAPFFCLPGIVIRLIAVFMNVGAPAMGH